MHFLLKHTPHTTLPLAIAATMLAGCLLDWDGPRPAAVPADRGGEARPGDAAPSDLVSEHPTPDDAYPVDQPWLDALPDAAPDTTTAPDAADAAPTDTKPADLVPQPDATPVCAYRFIGNTSPALFTIELNLATAAGWKLLSYDQGTPGHSALQVNPSGSYKLAASTLLSALTTTINVDLAKGWKVEAFGASVNAHVIWLQKTTSYKYLATTSHLTIAADLSKEIAAGWTVRTFADTAALYHSVWLESAGSYLHLHSAFPAILSKAVNDNVALGYKPVAFVSKHLHAVWLIKSNNYALYAPTTGSILSVSKGLNTLVANGSSVDTFASGSGPHNAWLLQGSSYTLRQAFLGGKLSAMVNKDVAAGWQVAALQSKNNYNAWLKNSLCP